jgi:hypothetical protein
MKAEVLSLDECEPQSPSFKVRASLCSALWRKFKARERWEQGAAVAGLVLILGLLVYAAVPKSQSYGGSSLISQWVALVDENKELQKKEPNHDSESYKKARKVIYDKMDAGRFLPFLFLAGLLANPFLPVLLPPEESFSDIPIEVIRNDDAVRACCFDIGYDKMPSVFPFVFNRINHPLRSRRVLFNPLGFNFGEGGLNFAEGFF